MDQQAVERHSGQHRGDERQDSERRQGGRGDRWTGAQPGKPDQQPTDQPVQRLSSSGRPN